MRIEWDEHKNQINIRKHKVSFEEAQSVFYDPLTKVASDPDHSHDEDRFLAVGRSSAGRNLLVVHCYRDRERIIRIISARRLNRSERRQFEEEIL